MITNEFFSDELLQHAAAKLAASNDSLPSLNKFLQNFSLGLEEKMQALLQSKAVCF